MATANTARRAVVHALLSWCAVAAVAGCLGDPPPDPETAPLEVVLDGCLLNRPEVAAGTHDLALVGDGQLVVTDEAGKEVLSLPGGTASLVTSSQTYTFTCTVGTEVTSATLESVSISR